MYQGTFMRSVITKYKWKNCITYWTYFFNQKYFLETPFWNISCSRKPVGVQTCNRVLILVKLQAWVCNFTTNRIPLLVFSSEFCKVSRKSKSIEHLCASTIFQIHVDSETNTDIFLKSTVLFILSYFIILLLNTLHLF